MSLIAVYRQRCTEPDIRQRQSELDRAWSAFAPMSGIDILLYAGPDTIRLGWTLIDPDTIIHPQTAAVAEHLAAQYGGD